MTTGQNPNALSWLIKDAPFDKSGKPTFGTLKWFDKIETAVSRSLTALGINANATVNGQAIGGTIQHLSPNGQLQPNGIGFTQANVPGTVSPGQVGFTLDSVPNGAALLSRTGLHSLVLFPKSASGSSVHSALLALAAVRLVQQHSPAYSLRRCSTIPRLLPRLEVQMQ